ncbi:uncharacterized protein LOC134817127 [Bolinopsis microptera]|uniref:uncharacterized protein LOC134817127 n=1 Tax=Bolinopsis microptera TaxID=2820187 RepID=UPI0030793AAE
MLFVLICAFSAFLAVSGDCDGVCWFAFDNRDGKKDSDNLMWVKTDSTQPTGLVTIGGTYLTDTSSGMVDTLRFQNYGDSKANYEPLIFQHEFLTDSNKLNIYGSKNGISTTYEQSISGIANTGDFELTFSSLSKDKIFVQYSDDNKSKAAVLFTYNDNWSSWGPLSGTPYYDTNRIFSQMKRTKYRYVHICKTEQPSMCDATLEPETELEEEVLLKCTAVGPATLTVEWTASANNDAVNSALNTKTDVLRDIGSVIESTLTISTFSLGHVASYTCKVSSSLNSLQKTQIFNLAYTREIRVDPVEEQNYYLSDTQDASFSFQVTGWPLADVTIITHYDKKEDQGTDDENDNDTEKDGDTNNDVDDNNNNIDEGDELFTLTRSEEYTAVPPRVTFKVQFNKQIPGDQFAFYFIDNTGGFNKTVRTYNVYKVGVACKEGEYGVGTQCKACGVDETSPPKSNDISDCVKATSNCKAGYYGVNDDCTKCPEGETSSDKTLSLSSCIDDPNYQENTGDDKSGSNTGAIVGGVIGGVLLLLILLAVLYYCVCMKGAAKKAVSVESRHVEPRGLERRGTVTVNKSADDLDLETSKKIDEDSGTEEENNLYDNRNLQSFRKRTQKSKQKNSTIDQHLDNIDSDIKTLADIQIEDEEPAYAELDQDHYRKVKEEKEEKRRTLGYPSERRKSVGPVEPAEPTYAEAQDVEVRRPTAN